MRKTVALFVVLLLVCVAQAAPKTRAIHVLGSAWNDTTETPWAGQNYDVALSYTNLLGQACIAYGSGTTDANGEIVKDIVLTNPDLTKGCSVSITPSALPQWHLEYGGTGSESPIASTITASVMFLQSQ